MLKESEEGQGPLAFCVVTFCSIMVTTALYLNYLSHIICTYVISSSVNTDCKKLCFASPAPSVFVIDAPTTATVQCLTLDMTNWVSTCLSILEVTFFN